MSTSEANRPTQKWTICAHGREAACVLSGAPSW